MKNIIFLLTALLFSSFIVISQTIDSTLFKAYNHNSKIILNEFFTNWENSFEVSNPEFINQNDTVKELYNVLNEFYNPYVTTKYFIIKDTLDYGICYSSNLPGFYERDTTFKVIKNNISNFQPFDKINRTKFLYLNDIYLNSLCAFLPYQKVETKEGWKELRKAYKEKLSFLSGYLIINDKGMSDDPWVDKHKLLSDPMVYYVMLNFKLDTANIIYTIGCSGRLAQYSKLRGVWEKIGDNYLFDC